MMEQPVIAKVLISFLVVAGASTQNPFIKGPGQSAVTIQRVPTTTKHWYPTGRPVSAISSLFVCADGSRSINRTLLCNGRIDCLDSSDENSQLCFGTSCMATFPCLNGKCKRLDSVCNGLNDCGDNSDEDLSICHWPASSQVVTCANGQVLIGVNMLCNGVYNCVDKSDEFNCSKCPGQLMCDKGFRCVKLEAFCDRIQDCFDGADEDCLIPNNQRCNVGDFICPTGKCVTKDKIMSGNRCWGSHVLTREENLKYCKLPNVLCDNATKCISPEYRCDGKLDCLDGSDEISPNRNIISDPSFKCANGYCVPYMAMCDGINDCGNSSDELPINDQCLSFSAVNCTSVQNMGSYYWQCNNSLCIPFYQVNNDRNNCGDFSDEKNSSIFYFTCTNGKKVLRSFLCDGRDNCGDNSDENYWSCTVNTQRPTCPQHTCHSGECIHFTDICDGYIDCGDNSDEQACPLRTRRSICLEHKCPSGKCIRYTDVCDGYNDCGDNSDELLCRVTTRRPICLEHTCLSGKCILFTDVCDGYNDCGDNSDEQSCPLTTRGSICLEHTCPSGKCILISEVCDEDLDCEDGSDETDCSGTDDTETETTHSYTTVASGVGVPGGVVIFVGCWCGVKRKRVRTTTRTTRTIIATTTQMTSTASSTPAENITVSTINVPSDLPPSYDQVVHPSAPSQGSANRASANSA